MDVWVDHVRHAVRKLTKSPFFSFVAVLSLALGIGANTAMFSLVNAVVLRAQPFADPGTLVDIYESSEGFSHGTLSYPDYVDFREATGDVFTDVAGIQLALVQVDVEGGVRAVPAEAVTGNYFPLLGVDAALGRLLTEEDHVAPGAHPVVVLGHGWWQRERGGDPDIVGTDIRLSGRPFTVVGVAPADFPGTIRGLEPAMYVPIYMYDALEGNESSILDARGNHSFFAKARLRPSASMAEVEAVASRFTADMQELHPRYWSADNEVVLVPTTDVIMNPMIDRFIVPAAGTVMVVVGLVLLIACANLASFLLARAADRRKEVALRLALGAGRRSLVAQLLTETVLLAALGGVAGTLLAVQALRVLTTADLPLPLPITLDLSLDPVVLGYSCLVSLFAGLLFGLAPALQSTNPDLASTLRDETAGGGGGRGARLRDALVAGQVAVSVVLLVAAGLFLRSLDAARSIDAGFGEAPAGLLQLKAPADRYTEEEARLFFAELAARLESAPGVRAVGWIDNLHLNQLSTQSERVRVEGVELPPGEAFHSVDYARASVGFLDAVGTPVVAGRDFEEADADGDPVALVTEAFVRRFFPDADAVGRTIFVDDEAVRVVGVTADHKVRRIGEEPRPFLLLSHDQQFTRWATFVARTDGDVGALALTMLSTARELDSEIMIAESKTMERHLAVMYVGRELGAAVIAGFAVLALLLASVGLYGVVGYAVARRSREVGIRLSLGADAATVVRMLTGDGLRLVAIGAAVGLLLAAGLARLMSTLLYGVPTLDPVTFLGVPAALAVVAFVAAWVPARRATRVDPAGALRAE